jgi:hypothetical protein
MVVDPVILRGATFASAAGGLTILARAERGFIPAILNGLRTASGRQVIAATAIPAPGTGQTLKLYQPIHQLFHVAMAEICCDTYGTPRLDPAKIDSAGLVVRRLAVDDNRNLTGQREAWCKVDDRIQGWMPLANNQLDLDPDPSKRPAQLKSGNAEIDSLLPIFAALAPGTESVTPFFPAPPDVCKEAKRTLLYGIIPVTSSEKSEAPPAQADFSAADLLNSLPFFLQDEPSRPGEAAKMLRPNTTITTADAGSIDLIVLTNALFQVQVEFDAFGTAPASVQFFNFLNGFTLVDDNAQPVNKLGDFLQNAATVLLAKTPGSSVRVPDHWPRFSPADRDQAVRLVKEVLRTRSAALLGGDARYQNPARQYTIRAFARLKRPDGCPPKLFWSDESVPFIIAPWYDNAGLPPVRIDLPDLNLDFLKSLKPNVAFSVPPSLFNTLQKDPRQSAQGKDSAGGGVTIGWICSFSIPIITICAFIVLNIFLSLFDIFFQWMLFIKICIPIPLPKKST